MKWRVWYRHHSLAVSSFEEWTALEDGIEGVIEYETSLTPAGYPTRVLIAGGDWYWWHEGHIKTDGPNYDRGTWSDPPTDVCSSCLKQSGEWLDEEEWNRIRLSMMEHKTWL